VAAAVRAARDGWSVRTTEHWAGEQARRRATAILEGEPSAILGATAARAAHLAALEKQLGEHLGTPVRIRTDAKGRRGRIVIGFYSLEQFEGLMERMGFRMES
jgi:ParB-like chromosome segregation protein Spo0J